MILVSFCSCLCPIHWNHVLSWEWRCSWSSADRRCSNYIWVINNYIAYYGAPYSRGLTVSYTESLCSHKLIYCNCHQMITHFLFLLSFLFSLSYSILLYCAMKKIEFRLKCNWILFWRVHLLISHHWFRYWLSAVHSPCHYLNQWRSGSLTLLCVSRSRSFHGYI